MAKDKIKHMMAGAIIALPSIWIGMTYALILVAVAGVGKEVYDRLGNGTPDFRDVIATIAGGVLMIIVLELLT